MSPHLPIPQCERVLLPRALVGRLSAVQHFPYRWRVGQLIRFAANTWIVDRRRTSPMGRRYFTLIRHDAGLEITAVLQETAAGLVVIHEDRRKTPNTPPLI